jgi:hypothetical protein
VRVRVSGKCAKKRRKGGNLTLNRTPVVYHSNPQDRPLTGLEITLFLLATSTFFVHYRRQWGDNRKPHNHLLDGPGIGKADTCHTTYS